MLFPLGFRATAAKSPGFADCTTTCFQTPPGEGERVPTRPRAGQSVVLFALTERVTPVTASVAIAVNRQPCTLARRWYQRKGRTPPGMGWPAIWIQPCSA